MADTEKMAAAFAELAALFAPYRDDLVVQTDEPGHLSLYALPSPAYPKGLFFGAVKIGKRYVSFPLMPVYVHPELLGGVSPDLRKRMQGKLCLSFAAPDEVLFAEWRTLIRAGFDAYGREGTIPALAIGR